MKEIIGFIKRYVLAVLSCLYLFTLGFLFARNRPLITRICRHFGFKGPKAIIPNIEFSHLVDPDISIVIHEPIVVGGNLPLTELLFLIQFIRRTNPSKVFEFGTFDGRTTLNIAANCGKETTVYTIDLQKGEMASTALPLVRGDKEFINKKVSGSRYLGTEFEKKIIQLYGDTATFDFSHFFNDIDIVFVDASHSYDYTLNDSKIALKLVNKDKGAIFWHDYDDYEGVTRALNELYLTVPQFKNVRHIVGTSLACLIVNLE